MLTRVATALAVVCALSPAACSTSENNATSSSTATTGSGGSTTSTTDAASSGSGASTSDGGGGAAPVDPCGSALLCEKFEDYASVTTIDDNQQFGPWRAALATPGAVMDLDTTHAVSGTHALHMSIETGATAGGRLFTDGNQPIFQGIPTHIYGRMMLYIDPNGTSVHWTFFGASGDAEPSSPVVGRRATYLMSSLPANNVNTYSFVYGLAADANDPYHDCWFRSNEPMPTAQWTCVAFEMDSVARKLRMTMDAATAPAVAVDDYGQGCVGNVVPGDSPWYGPAIEQLYVGAWSFHPMDAPLEVWIDDLVVDTDPVACP